MLEVFKRPPVFIFIEDLNEFLSQSKFQDYWLCTMFLYGLKMNNLGNIKLQERFVLRKRINLEHFSRYLQHGKILSTMFGGTFYCGTFYCVRGDLSIKAKKKKKDSIWENHVRKQSLLKVTVWNKISLTVTIQATMISIHSIFHERTQIA
ncbi:Hypothetical_protein [Hexamita inflata]|uniref:Hypothetical_protein n=1 Tax=Hexamita inflata TaxID=28002 RepID=A0AA86NTY7_9EUKA|nr:Hypothetical protein HINF_LOCUS14142 [Hexamita inflata]